ncbi:uncharacterized protein EI90DRAFT_532092 [Cantharellus anzutake]|uniref:uncharacterized protein n=1 Tax=Cantharellus anzutake TaxID=1750568 RepID=UPI001903A643|nr:uncharacterized protein EI90DRAFT_532092 [Cantharellus anzutake]KAF8334286.1 hypothetical protein EI90DRAFT_532092 [Cantharellus anzutake]
MWKELNCTTPTFSQSTSLLKPLPICLPSSIPCPSLLPSPCPSAQPAQCISVDDLPGFVLPKPAQSSRCLAQWVMKTSLSALSQPYLPAISQHHASPSPNYALANIKACTGRVYVMDDVHHQQSYDHHPPVPGAFLPLSPGRKLEMVVKLPILTYSVPLIHAHQSPPRLHPHQHKNWTGDAGWIEHESSLLGQAQLEPEESQEEVGVESDMEHLIEEPFIQLGKTVRSQNVLLGRILTLAMDFGAAKGPEVEKTVKGHLKASTRRSLAWRLRLRNGRDWG